MVSQQEQHEQQQRQQGSKDSNKSSKSSKRSSKGGKDSTSSSKHRVQHQGVIVSHRVKYYGVIFSTTKVKARCPAMPGKGPCRLGNVQYVRSRVSQKTRDEYRY